MQVWKRGDGDGVEDGELCCEEESPAVREQSADLGVYPNPKKARISTELPHYNTTLPSNEQ
jgi:hypothetical protein